MDYIIENVNNKALVQYNPPHTPLTYRTTLDSIWPYPQKHLWGSRYQEYYDIYTQVHTTVIPNYIGECIPVPSGLNILAWRSLLTDYHDKQLPDFLEFGWPADYSAETPPVPMTANHYNDAESVSHMEDYFNTDLANKRRVIVDLGYPKGASVNAGIRRGQYEGRPFTYTLPAKIDLADELTRNGQ